MRLDGRIEVSVDSSARGERHAPIAWTFFHASCKPRSPISRSSSARSIASGEVSSIERISRRCFSDPLSRARPSR